MWPCPELDEVVHIRTGTINPLKYPEMEFELFSIPGFDIGSPEIKVGSEILSNKNVVKPDDVLFSKLNPRIPRIWIVPKSKHRRQISSTEFWPLVCDQRLLSNHYLRYFLLKLAKEGVFSDSIEAATRSRSRIKPFHLLHQHIPLPPLSEQRRIVEILDQADALRKKRAEADAKAARILPALFYKMFGDPATNPTGWDQKPFDLAFEDCTAQFPKLQRNAYQVTGRFPVVDQCKELVAGYCDDESLVTHVANPVIVFGDHTRIVKYVDFPFVAGADGSRVFAAKEGFLPAFLAMQLELQPIPNLGYSRHMREVRRLRFIAPPASLQRRYAERAESIRPLLKAQTSCRDNIESIWQTLLHHAFTGYLTAKWREAHMKELLAEMEHQAKALKIDDFRSPIEEDYKSSIINHQSEIPHD